MWSAGTSLSSDTVSVQIYTAAAAAAPPTFSQVLDCFPYAPVESSGVGWTLEGQAALPVLHLPMMKCGRCYGVDQVFPQRTVQDHLWWHNGGHCPSLVLLEMTCHVLVFTSVCVCVFSPVCPVAARHG